MQKSWIQLQVLEKNVVLQLWTLLHLYQREIDVSAIQGADR